MARYHIISRRQINLEETLDLSSLLNSRVLSHNGLIIGKISQIRINPNTLRIEGILVKRGLFRKSIYIGSSYFDKMTSKSVILSIEPVIFLKNRNVLSFEGKKIGKVKKVIRKDNTNEIKEIIVSSIINGRFSVPAGQVKQFGKSIILQKNYNAKQKRNRR